jgi:RNA polymerase-binding transcription factor DksA
MKIKNCERCGDPISPKRLDAIPEATQCIECAQKTQRKGSLIRSTDRRVMNALVELSEGDEGMFAPEAHE